MVLDKLGETLKATLEKIRNAVLVDDTLMNELTKDLQRVLLQSDVNVKLVFSLTNNIKEIIKKSDIPQGISKKEFLVKTVYDELVKFLGGEGSKININKKQFKIMLVGLFGNGKTTTAGKLAKFYTKRGLKVALVQTDTWRPAAFHQLETLGRQINVPVFGNPKLKDPIKIYESFEKELDKFDLIIIDTAGRDALSDELIDELNRINKRIKPDENLLVMSADIGQAAENQAKAFHEAVNVTGVIITKLEGTAKGGGALTACSVTKAPVKFIGVGEKIDDFEEFDPKRFVSKLLGFGDIEGLLEKVKEAVTEEEAKDMGKKFLKGDYNLIDLYEQMSAMRKMGPLTKIMEMIPGMGQMKIPKDVLQQQEVKIEKWKYIMDSCTKEELEDPEIISSERIERIARGSGVSQAEVREMLKQYKQSKKMVKMLKGQAGSSKKMQQMMRKLQAAGINQNI